MNKKVLVTLGYAATALAVFLLGDKWKINISLKQKV